MRKKGHRQVSSSGNDVRQVFSSSSGERIDSVVDTNAATLSGASRGNEFWERLPDHEFFGPSVTHIYFYEVVTEESVLRLRQAVLEATQGFSTPLLPDPQMAPPSMTVTTPQLNMAPKPIVVHIHSPGGSVLAENWLLSLFNQVHVPLCAMVDCWSASAATSLSVMAPYRVGTPWSVSLLHDYSAAFYGKREQLIAQQADIERHRTLYKKLYLSRTRISEPELESLLRRDIWLDASTCVRLGIYDRIVSPDRGADALRILRSLSKLPKQLPFVKRNWNQVYATCDSSTVAHLDAILATPQSAMRPVVYVVPGAAQCDDPESSLAAISRIRASPVPVFGVVDNYVTWWQFLPVLFCHRRYMYENAVVDSMMQYNTNWGWRINDIVHNANVMRGIISRAVKTRGKPSAAFMADMFDRFKYITANDCLANGLIDEVVPLDAGRPSSSSSRSHHKHKHHYQVHQAAATAGTETDKKPEASSRQRKKKYSPKAVRNGKKKT